MTGASEVDVVGIEEVQVRLQRRVEELQMDRVRVQRSVREALNACPTALVEFCRACKPYSVFRMSKITQPKPPASQLTHAINAEDMRSTQ